MGNMSSGGGLSNGKLELATASTGDVLTGKTYYAGDKELKTGTMANRRIAERGIIQLNLARLLRSRKAIIMVRAK